MKGGSLLVIGHPGHELRVFGWVERSRPLVFCLTDGGGAAGKPRWEHSAGLLERAGASLGDWFATLSDRELYAALMERRVAPFAERARQLAAAIALLRPQEVLCDMIEGYNPGHDLCGSITRAAIELAGVRGVRVARGLAFPLTGAPEAPPRPEVRPVVELVLSPAERRRKLAAARGYAALDGEVAAALDAFGPAAFEREVLFEAAPHDVPPLPPYYESHGERQVSRGLYARVLRYHEHMAPLVAGMRADLGLDAP